MDSDDDGKCDKCGEDFFDGDEPVCHHRDDDDDNFKCDMCGKSFTDGYESDEEIRHKDADGDGKCDDCGVKESSEGIKFNRNPDEKSYTVIGIGADANKDIIIETYNNQNVTEIGMFAFEDCVSIESVMIGRYVDIIGFTAFEGCTNLANITVDSNNTKYSSIDGNLYTKDGKTLILYARGKNDTRFIVPSGVVKIEPYALAYCKNITSITIPSSVEMIGNNAFCDCKKTY
jgi:hypothetical protein